MAIIGTAVGEASTTFNMLLACRIVQGFSISAFESLLVASVGLTILPSGLISGIYSLFINVALESPLLTS